MIEWWASAWKVLGAPVEELLFAIPNGGHRHAAVAAKLKAEGVRAGVLDLMLAMPKGGFHGLFIEMKREKTGRVSDQQETFVRELRLQCYNVMVCWNADEAIRTISAYMKQPRVD